jgi:hypothetical protein
VASKAHFSETKHFLTTSRRHSGLLWVLEVLAWDSMHLPRVAHILARLAVIDPGGRLANRPTKSLLSISSRVYPQSGFGPTRGQH